MVRTIKNLLFDLGNVIIPIDESKSTTALAQLIGQDALDRFEREFFYAYERGQLSSEALINHLQRLGSGDPPQPDLIETAWNKMLDDIPPHRIEMLKNLCGKYRVFILSNTNHIHLKWVQGHLQSRFGISDFKDECAHNVFYSHEIGQRKPDKEVYEHVLKETRIKAEETLFFDDKPENLLAARKEGFWVYQVRPEDEIARIVTDLSL